ncbi:MAG: hypothetical protein IIA45_05885 [Bacteroidetes bacterium]|nr:hypothetical protein [Bacteroidota bacterium]
MEENVNRVVGTGLVALDVILNGSSESIPSVASGGSCANVLAILSFLGSKSHLISRLNNTNAAKLLLADLRKWNVDTSLISTKDDGSTPIIIHRILQDKRGNPKHRFEFKDPFSGRWFPSYKPVLAITVEELKQKIPKPKVFYFDKINRASIELAKISRQQNALIVFEPSSLNESRLFKECLEVSHVLKFSKDRIKKYSEIFPKIQVPLEIETLGIHGLKYRFKSSKWKHLKPFIVGKAIDGAGAGDWCTAGIIEHLGPKGIDYLDLNSNWQGIEEILNYGQALGALNCLFVGAKGIMEYIQKVDLGKLIAEIQNERMQPNAEEFSQIKLDSKVSVNLEARSLFRLLLSSNSKKVLPSLG